MRVLLRGDLDQYYGDTVGLITALIRRGFEVHLEPEHVTVPLPADIAVLLTRARPAKFDLILHHVRAVQILAPEDAGDAITVAWTFGRYPGSLPGIVGYDLVVSYDDDTNSTIRCDGCPQATVHGGYIARDWPAIGRDWFDSLGFLVVDFPGSEIVAAFDELRKTHPGSMTGVDLTVHTRKPIAGTQPGVRYLHGEYDTETWRDIFADHHVLIAPPRHRDSAALQFLSTGGTVIGTRAGSAQQWLSSTVGYPIDWRMQNRDGRGEFETAVLSILQMRAEAKRRAETAARLIPEMTSWDKALDRLQQLIDQHIPGRGERFAHGAKVLAQQAKDKRR